MKLRKTFKFLAVFFLFCYVFVISSTYHFLYREKNHRSNETIEQGFAIRSTIEPTLQQHEHTTLSPLQVLTRESLRRNQTETQDPILQPPHTIGAFIHIGKTGGSTLSSLLRNGCHSFVPKPCMDPDGNFRYTKFGTKESAISLLTTYYHEPDFKSSTLLPYAHNYDFFLFTVRDPLDRTISSYLHTHPENSLAWKYQAYRKKAVFEEMLKELGTEDAVYEVFKENVRNMTTHQNDVKIYRCFPILQSFADLFDVNDEEKSEDNLDERDVTDEGKCAIAAKMTLHFGDCFRRILGVYGGRGMDHAFYDYHMIAFLLRDVDFTEKTILVTRTDHMSDDWISANRYLGQEGTIVTPDTVMRDSSKSSYPVKKELNEQGRKNLCIALKGQYQIYLSLLVHAKNLSREEVADSIEYSKKNCPWLDLTIPDEDGDMAIFNTLTEDATGGRWDFCSDDDGYYIPGV